MQRDADRAFETVLKHEIRKLNMHLPKNRRTVRDLLLDDTPSVSAVNGEPIIMRREEIVRLASQIPEHLHEKIRLPFVLLRRMDLGKSVFTVTGERIEEFTVRKVLGLTERDFKEYTMERQPFHLYRPQIGELMRRYHSLFVLAFGTQSEFAE